MYDRQSSFSKESKSCGLSDSRLTSKESGALWLLSTKMWWYEQLQYVLMRQAVAVSG